MTKKRSSFMWKFMHGIAVFAVVLLAVGCATTDDPTTQQRAAEPDLTGAHLDKRKFLIGVSMLGQSVEKDIKILRNITGHTFVPKQEEQSYSQERKWYRSFEQLNQTSPMLLTGSHDYYVDHDLRYRPGIRILFDRPSTCVSAEDVTSVLGAPTRTTTRKDMRAKGLGPNDIANIIYSRPNQLRLVFSFQTAVCAQFFVLLPDEQNPKGQV